MQDAALPDQQVKELNGILDGSVPYDDLKYKELVEQNQVALQTMARGTSLPTCDWEPDYELRDDAPVDYVRNALVLGRLNVLYTFHRLIAHDREGSVGALVAGLRFSRDVANGGTLFATVVAKDLLVSHLQALQFALQVGELSADERLKLQKAVAQLGAGGLDWQSALKREMEALNRPDWRMSIPLDRVTRAYVAALGHPSTLPDLQETIAGLPLPLRDVIPNPKRVLQEKRELTMKIDETHARFISK